MQLKEGHNMKLNGTHQFTANSAKVYNAILDPAIIKQAVPGCESAEILNPTQLLLNVNVPLPGFSNTIGVIIDLLEQDSPNKLVLGVKKGGKIDAKATILINDGDKGALLSYDANADLAGPLSIAGAVVKPFVDKSLKSVFDKLDQVLG